MILPRFGGFPAFVVLSNKEQAARACLVRQRTPTQYVRDDYLGEISLNAALHWFLDGSKQWLSTGSAGEPQKRVKVKDPSEGEWEQIISWLVANRERSSGDIFRELQCRSPGRY